MGNNYCQTDSSVPVLNSGSKPSRNQLKELNKCTREKEAEREELKIMDEEKKEAENEKGKWNAGCGCISWRTG